MNRTQLHGNRITQRFFKKSRAEILARLKGPISVEEKAKLEAQLADLRERAIASGHRSSAALKRKPVAPAAGHPTAFSKRAQYDSEAPPAQPEDSQFSDQEKLDFHFLMCEMMADKPETVARYCREFGEKYPHLQEKGNLAAVIEHLKAQPVYVSFCPGEPVWFNDGKPAPPHFPSDEATDGNNH